MTEIVERNELIATRTPPGDNWHLSPNVAPDQKDPISGLVQVLTEYVKLTKFKGDFRLCPLDGELYAIKEEVIQKEDPVEEKWDLYGES